MKSYATRSFIQSIMLSTIGITTACAPGAAPQQQAPGAKEESAAIGGSASELDGGASEVYRLWCNKAQETAIVKDRLRDFYGRFCGSDGPKQLLTRTLIRKAYSGGSSAKGSIALIEKVSHDQGEKTTEMLIGVAIRLPISIEQHFNDVAPMQGDPEHAEKSGAYPKDADVTVKILDSYKADGKYHVRGFKSDTNAKTKAAGTSIETHTQTRADQFELVEGNAYLYTNYVTKSIKQVKDTTLMTAGIRDNNVSYLITQAYIRVDNLGLPSVAEATIKDTAEQLVKSMYNIAKEKR